MEENISRCHAGGGAKPRTGIALRGASRSAIARPCFPASSTHPLFRHCDSGPFVFTDDPGVLNFKEQTARISTRTQEIQSQVDALEASGVHRLFQEQISTRVRERPEMKAALAAAREYRSLGAKVTLVVHEMKRLGRDALELPRQPKKTAAAKP
ncbi:MULTISPECIES: recombinase family protein [unclassified Streptomyces]|uniref:recombinase family protein n=1 Tax=unclassified Streptomyces TaxID=2593676 RepID=UPI002259F3F9|nr:MULTISPECIES: recombinase family protein [unclassified Streptomyces]MCX4799760.1 recombinase family protein [Streptomyces sp. NBC_01242]WSJ41449.1 recombinase family protein [Streptomyces sp. NBC_01321]WSP67732.1 recombinase family protein [Streptomyces sp. NBC_01240]WSU26826.1 recombinase family protein [Streptomyces sp. NBC_01108]